MIKMRKSALNKCPLCESSKIQDICSKDYAVTSFGTGVLNTYSICKKCFFVFTKNPPSPSVLDLYYKNNSQERTSHADKNEMRHMVQQISFIKGSINLSGLSVLEVGANNGSFLEMIKKAGGKKLYFLEMNKESLRLLNKKKYLSDFNKIDEQKKHKCLDCIVMMHTLEHILRPVAFVKKFARYLRDDGVFVVEVPDFTFKGADTDELIFEHVNFFSESTLRRLFLRAGLTMVSSQITIDRNYPVCTKRTIRMIVKKNLILPKTVSSNISMFKSLKAGKETAFKKMELYINNLSSDCVLGIYTASWLATECINNSESLRKRAGAIFDRDLKKQGGMIQNIPIYDPSYIPKLGINRLIILNEGYEKEIREYLQKTGFPKKKIVGWSDFV